MSSINFDNIYWLFIAIPLAILLLVPFFIAIRKDNVNGHNVASAVIHIILAVLIAFTAAGTKIITVITQTYVYVVADVSYSANRNLDVVDGYINDLKEELPQNSKMGVICFGKDYQLITLPGDNFTSVKDAKVDDSQTNIISALDYAGKLFPDGVIKRIVLITDGNQTDSTDSNSLKREVDSLNAINIKVDAIYLDDNITDEIKEVQMTEVNYTSVAYLNNSEVVSAVLQSNYQGNAVVTLSKDGKEIITKAININNGTTTVDLDLDTSESGTFDYEVSVSAEDDYNTHNNSVSFTQEVAGNVSILLITDDDEDLATIEEKYSKNADVTAYINGDISRESYINYGDDIIDSLPVSVEALCAYDEIILSDLDITELPNYEMFLQSLEKAVSRFGKSLITLGNLELQNTEDTTLETLRKMLPVEFGNDAMDPKLYTIVLDVSRSVGLNENSETFIRLKKTASKLVEILPDGDSLSVVIFYGTAQVDLIDTVLSVDNRDAIKERIENYELMQGTMISGGLRTAYENMVGLNNFSEKQVMLISDGLKGTNETIQDITDIAADMAASGIVTNVFDIGQTTMASATDRALAPGILKAIAQNGLGEYYLAENLDEVDEIIFGTLADNLNELVVENYDSAIKIKKRYDDVMQGITNMGYISGYVNSKKAKGNATVVLTTEYQNTSGGKKEVPIYAYYSYGNGMVSTFTSKLSGDWIEGLTAYGVEEKFFNNVISTNTPAEKISNPFLVSTRNDSGICYVEVTPASLHADTEATIKVTTPDEEVIEGHLTFDSSIYTYSFSAADVGKYVMSITYSYGGNEYTTTSTINVSYGAEYNSFAVFDSTVLHKMVGTYGTVSENGVLKIENDENEVSTMTVTLTVPLMIACVALYAVDIIIRKLKWNDVVSFFKINKLGNKK